MFADGALFALRGRKLREVCRPACALNCCHGMGGEDGAVSGLLDLNGIPNASPDMAGSAIFMDKALTKLFAKSVGVRTLPYFRLGEAEYAKRRRVRPQMRGKAGLSRHRQAEQAGLEHRP